MIVGSRPLDANARRVMSMAVNNNGVLGMIMVERRLDVRDSCLEQLFAASFDGGES